MATVKINVPIIKEQSVLHVDGTNQNEGSAKLLYGPVGRFGNGDLVRDLILPGFEWTSNIYRLLAAKLVAEGSGGILIANGSDPQIRLRRLASGFTSTGGQTSGWSESAVNQWANQPGVTGTIVTSSVFGSPNGTQRVDVIDMVEDIAPAWVKRRDGTPGGAAVFHGWRVSSPDEGSSDSRWEYFGMRATLPTTRLYVELTFDDNQPPDSPQIDALVGAVSDTSDPVYVGTVGGKELTVQYTARLRGGDTNTRSELQVWADGATADEEAATQPVTGTLVATTGSIVPTARGSVNAFSIRITGLPARTILRYRLRNQNQKGAWGRWSPLEDGRFRTAYVPGIPINPTMTTDPQAPRLGATLNSQDPLDFLTGWSGQFLRYNVDGSTTNLWPNLGKIDIGGGTVGPPPAPTRADIPWGGVGLNDGDRVSSRQRLYNRDGIPSPLTPEKTTVMHTQVGPTITPPDTGTKLLSRGGPITITDTIGFDAVQYYLFRNDVQFRDSGTVATTPGLAAVITFPDGTLNWGDTIGIEARTRPTGTTDWGPWSPRTYLYIDTLPSTSLVADDGDGFAGPVIPTTDIRWVSPYTDPDVSTYGEEPVAKTLEVRVAASPAGSGALLIERENVASLGWLPENERTGRRLDLLTDATNTTVDTNVTADLAASAPTGYAGNSLRIRFTGASSTDRGARKTLSTGAQDLSVFGPQALFRIQRFVTSSTNLVRIVCRFEFATSGDWSEYSIFEAADALSAWAETYLTIGGPRATSGTVDWSLFSGVVRFFADVSGAYTGDLYVRDLRIGVTQTAKTVPDGSIAPETSVDARVRYQDDATALVATTLAATAALGATNLKLTSVTGLVVGQPLTIRNDGAGHAAFSTTRNITAVGTAGSGGTGVTVDAGIGFGGLSGWKVWVFPWGPWTPWLTRKASIPPVVVATSPADAAVVTDPTVDFVHTYVSAGGKAQAYRTLLVFDRVDGEDKQIYEADLLGTGLTDPAPVYLLEDGHTYAWEKTAYDTDGLPGSTARLTFTTSFTVPDPVTDLVAEADSSSGVIRLAWTASTDPHLAFYIVRWRDADNQPLRVDLGPRTLDDGRTPLTAAEFSFRGGRLGVNTFSVSVHNGAQESEPVDVAVTREPARAGAWMLTVDDETGRAYAFDPKDMPRTWTSTVETFRPPSRPFPVHHHWGLSGRRVSVRITYLVEDGPLARVLGNLLHTGAAFFVAAASPYEWDVMRCRVTALGPESVQPYALVDVSVEMDEIAPEAPT